MKEITIEIGDLFKFLESQYNTVFPEDQLIESPIDIKTLDENGNWAKCSKLIKKTSNVIDIKFKDGRSETVADKHIYSIDPKKDISIYAKDLKIGDSVASKSKAAIISSITPKENSESVYGLQIETEKHLYQTADGIIHHNTYECTRALNDNISYNFRKAKSLYYKGNIGKSLTACCAFFYNYRKNYIIMLDDNDAMLMKSGVAQTVKLFFKAVLDPDAAGQPISVPTTILKGASQAVGELQKNEGAALEKKAAAKKASSKKKQREAIKISIDRDRLREGIFNICINNKEVLDERVPMDEALELYHNLTPLRETESRKPVWSPSWSKLNEGRIDPEDVDDLDWDELKEKASADEEDENESDEFFGDLIDDEEGMPTEFIFDSSVIFISNLSKKDIDPAVWDRFTAARIELTPMEFMGRLGKIYGNLGNVNRDISSVPQEYVDWAKKCVYGTLLALIEAWKFKTPIFGVTIQIPRRTLTFRLFNSFVGYFLRSARAFTRRTGGGDLGNEKYRTKVACEIERKLVREMINKIVLGE
jgi:hypothetical protein